MLAGGCLSWCEATTAVIVGHGIVSGAAAGAGAGLPAATAFGVFMADTRVAPLSGAGLCCLKQLRAQLQHMRGMSGDARIRRGWGWMGRVYGHAQSLPCARDAPLYSTVESFCTILVK